MCRSTCFGRLHTHHQELTTALAASGFTLERGGSSVVSRGLVSASAPQDRMDHDIPVRLCTCIIIPRYFTVVQSFVFYRVEDSRNLKVFENSF
jgi:hypothetical protein